MVIHERISSVDNTPEENKPYTKVCNIFKLNYCAKKQYIYMMFEHATDPTTTVLC